MKTIFIIAMMVSALPGCSQRLHEQDRALLSSTHALAQQAQNDAIQAVQEAKQARAAAENAATDARVASDKTERIFWQGQNK